MTENITKRYKKYKLESSNETMKELCIVSKFKLQPQQQFLPEYIYDNKKNINGLLIYHRIGSGKTCTLIQIAERFKKEYNIMVVLPAALIGNLKDELLSQCPGNEVYIKKEEVEKRHDKDTMDKINKRIEKYYKIYSYNKFHELVQKNKIKLNNTLLFIDEIQNMISETGSFYSSLKNTIDKSDNTCKIFLFSANPMFDRPSEIALTLNLLKPKIELPIGNNFNNQFINNMKITNIKLFKELTQNLVSYYRGAPEKAFPKMDFTTVRCNMNTFQYKSYLTILSKLNENIKNTFKNVDILKLPNNFFLGPRMISNIAFPNKSITDVGLSSLTKETMKLENISNYSIKFYKILKKIKKVDGPTFVYSNFLGSGGLKSFIKFIEYHGYKNYKVFGTGNKTYALWSGDETHQLKEKMKHAFNNKLNSDGSKIKILLGSPSIKEGISLLRVQQIHILEPYWNISRIQQIIGRGVRFCSHKDVPKDKQIVYVYLYLATHSKETKTVDQYIWSIAKQKHLLIEQFEHALKENAIDCELFHARNSLKNDILPLKCDNK